MSKSTQEGRRQKSPSLLYFFQKVDHWDIIWTSSITTNNRRWRKLRLIASSEDKQIVITSVKAYINACDGTAAYRARVQEVEDDHSLLQHSHQAQLPGTTSAAAPPQDEKKTLIMPIFISSDLCPHFLGIDDMNK